MSAAYKPMFRPGDGYAERAYSEYQTLGGVTTQRDFLAYCAIMHHHLEDANIGGEGCRQTAWGEYLDTMADQGVTPTECERVFYAVDAVASYT